MFEVVYKYKKSLMNYLQMLNVITFHRILEYK